MGPDNSNKKVGVHALAKKRKRITSEQKKLEKMIAELFEKKRPNIGEDLRILRQSCKLDQLIVDEMLLREMKKNYTK
jgi:hypothetical protein